LAYCQQKGIMKGDGYGNAMPGRTITPNEAVTMVLRAIGYTDNASVLVGQWPANYVSLGQSLNLYEKVSTDLQMNKASAAQMIYNVLTAQLVQVDANSAVLLLYDSDTVGAAKTLLTTGLNCKLDWANAVTDKESPDYGRKVVSYADAASSKINLVSKVGAFGKLYRSNVDGEAVALTEVTTVFLAGKFTYVDGTASPSEDNTYIGNVDKFQTTDGTKYNLNMTVKNDVKNRFTTSTAVDSEGYGSFVNGNDAWPVGIYTARYEASGDYDNFDNTSIKNYINNGKKPSGNASKLIIAAKVSGMTILELHSVAVWDAAISGYGDTFLYEAGQIDGKKFNGHDFPLDLNNEVDDYGYALAGVNSLDELVADNVIYIYKNSDKKIARIDVGTETQSGVITNINGADSQKTIGGKILGDSPYPHATQNDLKINNEGTALLDVYGRTFGFRLGEASKGNFAVFLADQVSFDSLQVKLFDKTEKEIIYGTKKEIKYNGVAKHPTITIKGNPAVAASNLNISGEPIVEYKLSSGSISELRVGHGADVEKVADKSSVNKTGTILTIKGNGSLNADYRLDSNTLVYVQNGDAYSIGDVKDLLDKDFKKDFRFITDEDDPRLIKALIVDSSDAGANDIFLLINSVTIGSDGAGGEIDVFNGLDFADGANAAVGSWSSDGNALGKQSLIGTPMKFRVGADGILKGSGTYLDDASLYTTDPDPTVTKAALSADPNGIWYYPSGNVFTLRTTAGLLTFEANAVLYKVDAGKWTAMRPTEGNFKADSEGSTYSFYKTDTAKAYDIIILE
jgi:hypothetical protein